MNSIFRWLICFLFLNITINTWNQNASDFHASGLDFFEKGNYKEALLKLNQALKIDSGNANYFSLRAEIYFQLGEYSRTIEDCYSSLRIQPNQAKIYILRGKVCTLTESYGGALLFYGKALKNTNFDEVRYQVYFNRAKAYVKIKRYQDALIDLNMAEGIAGADLDLLLVKAEAHFNVSQFSQAIELLNKAINMDPTYAPSYQWLGWIAEKKRDTQLAISSYTKYSQLMPHDYATCNSIALAYLEINDTDSSQIWLEKALNINTSEPQTHKTKGIILLKLGNTDAGCNAFFRALQLGYLKKYGTDLLELYLKECEN